MSKCFLVMDMPSSCEECILRNEGACFPVSKQTSICGVYYTMKEGRKPDWCPLKLMPSKKPTIGKESDNDILCMNAGYNACIDELLGEENG